MLDALVGHTGFVGSNIFLQHPFDRCYNSKSIEEICDQEFELLVCAGAPGVKWLANKYPQDDVKSLKLLGDSLLTVRAKLVVLISTVDVYDFPLDVDEDAEIDLSQLHQYGRGRLELETRLSRHFPNVLIVRLPALFGVGLRKNAIYDLIYKQRLEYLHPDSQFQFYDLNWLWNDINLALSKAIRLINLATEPILLSHLVNTVFPDVVLRKPDFAPAKYDVTSKHAQSLFGITGYVRDRMTVLEAIEQFVRTAGTPQ